MATKIALDAMGGDHAPGEIIRGAVMAADKYPNLEIILILIIKIYVKQRSS